ncbi:hypothetical protein BH24ACT5_BH24ACT5_07110 [soil metagenome]
MIVSIGSGAVAIGWAVMAVAVAGGSGSVPDTDPPGAAGSTPTVESPYTDEELEFQLDMMLGLMPDDEVQAYYAEDERERQERIQACMNEAGFDYNLEERGGIGFDGDLGLSSLEYAEQWGFGVYTMLDPEINPYDQDDAYAGSSNDEITDALSSAQQTSWFTMFDRCQNDSFDEPIGMNADFQQVVADFGSMIENDPRSVEAEATWRDCMVEAGHPFPNQQAMYEEAFNSDLQFQFVASSAWEESSPDHAAYLEAVQHEIDIAVASVPCSEALEAVYDTVAQDLRPELAEMWQTIDWNAPPIAYPDEFTPGEGGSPEDAGAETSWETSAAA